MRHRCCGAVLLVGAVLVSGCGRTATEDKVTYVATDDAKMNTAIARARAEVQTFIAALREPRPGQQGFSVKKPFTHGPDTEHIWLDPVSFDGTAFQGTVANVPEKIPNVKLGDQATVRPEEITDWMYNDNGRLVGGYTLRVLRDGMSPTERAELDRSVPFRFE